MLNHHIFLCIFSLIAISLCDTNTDTDTDNTTFIPTNEMQEIKDGQKVPAGLHYRINLTTGKKEAKLLEDDTKKINNDIKKINEKHDSIKNEIIIKELKEKFKQEQSEQKKRAKLMKSISAETNFESIKSLIKNAMKFKKGDDHSHEYMTILENCNILVHQIDYALTFIENDGIEHIILPTITNQTIIGIRIQSMRLVGALAQNNLVAQKKVYEKNIANYLCQALMVSTNIEELSTALFALGSILRNFPEAQKDILPSLGMRALMNQIGINIPLKLQIKTLTLLSDLIVEKNLESQHKPQSELNIFYKEIDFEDWLSKHKFCIRVNNLVKMNKNELSQEVYLLKSLLDAMTNFLIVCKVDWLNNNLLSHLHEIVIQLTDKTDYVFEIIQSFNEFFEKVIYKNQRDEL